MGADKPGYQTTEFYFSIVAALVGALLASGVIGKGTGLEQALGAIASALAAAGYSWSRGKAKS